MYFKKYTEAWKSTKSIAEENKAASVDLFGSICENKWNNLSSVVDNAGKILQLLLK